MIKKIFILLLLHISLNIFSQQIDPIQAKLCTIINNGTNENELLYDKDARPMGHTAVRIYNDNFIIADSLNSKIVVYNLNFQFLFAIKTGNDSAEYIFFPDDIKVDNENNFYLNNVDSFTKISKNGEKKYFLNRKNTILKKQNYKNFYIVNNKAYFYIEDKLYFISDEGEIKENIKNKIRGLAIFSDLEQNQSAIDFFNNNTILLENNIFLPMNYDQFVKFKNNLKSTGKRSSEIEEITPLKYYLNKLIGIDKDNNYYWSGYKRGQEMNRFIYIFSKEGNLITYFKNEYSFQIALRENGDIYFLKSTEEGHFIYKITRSW